MIIEDFAEILSEEILYLLHMEVRKKENVFETSTFLFLFVVCLFFLCIINNQWIIRLLVKETEELANYSTPVMALMTNDTL